MAHTEDAATHTATPWTAQPLAHGAYGIWGDINRLVAETRNTDSTYDRRPGSPSLPEVGKANAEYIIRAANSYPTLLAALQRYVDCDGVEDDIREQAQAAIEEAS